MTDAAPVLVKIPNYVNYLLWQPADSITEEAARKRFKERIGYEPSEVVRDHNGLWLGPVRKVEPK